MTGLRILTIAAAASLALATAPLSAQAASQDQNPKAQGAEPRGGGGPHGAGTAVPRNESAPPPPPPAAAPAGGGWAGGQSAPGGGAWRGGEPRRMPQSEGRANPRDRSAGAAGAVPIPGYSRPRGNNPVLGEAVPRRDLPSMPGRPTYPGRPHWPGSVWGYYPDYYYGGGYYPWGIGMLGVGYFYWDPSGWAYDPGYVGAYYGSSSYDMGGIRLKVKPNDAKVFVDGYYAGTVDEFDSWYQKLRLSYGQHRIEVRKDGYAPLVFDVNVQSGDTITYQGVLEPLRMPAEPIR